MQRSRHMLVPMTLLGISLIALSPLEVLISAFPWRFGEASWRFGMEGLLSNSILYPIFGIVLLVGASGMSTSSVFARATWLISGLFCGGIILLIGAFALDALQVRGSVPAPNHSAF